MDSLNPGLNSPLGSIPKGLKVSFEFFPPKTEKMHENLWLAVERLAPLKPQFMSVTYGAGGTTRERTHEVVARIQQETGLQAAAHLTCVGATRAEVDDVANHYWESGIRHIVALRGDPPEGETQYFPHPDGYDYAVDLVAGLKRVADFEITVAAYPEVHPQAESAQADLDNLKRKLDAGATRAISTFFFDNDVFTRFRDRASAAGINAPILPGILPLAHFKQACKFAAINGTSIPSWLHELFAGLDDDPETRKLVAATFAAEQVRRLIKEGVSEFHFYTLNRADLAYAICHILGIRPKTVK